jgi:PAS domain S-box-containing protein
MGRHVIQEREHPTYRRADLALAEMVDSLPALLWSALPDGRVQFLNRRLREYAGMSSDEPISAEWQPPVHPDDQSQWLERWRSMATTDEPWELEHRLRRSDGEYRWFLCRASPITDATGKVVRWDAINTDFDDRHRVEDDLRAAKTNFRGWAESFPGYMVTMSVSGEVELFSRDVLEYFGKTPEELRSWRMTDAVHPDDLPGVVAAFTESVESGKPYSIEHRCRRSDGVYRWFHVRALPVREQHGQITGWYVVLVDIDDAKRAEDAMRASELRIRRLIDANIIGIFMWHADGRVFDANEELLRIIGHGREELASGSLRWTDFTLPESRERDLRVLEDLRHGGKGGPYERELLRKDGTRVPVLTGGTMFGEGVPDEGVAFVVDLTDQKLAEQALRESERESHLILDTIPGMVAVLKPSGEIDAVNQELVAFCGQPLEAMKEWGTNGTMHPDDLAHMGPIFTEAIASDKPYDFEARIRRFDGVYRWLQVRGLPLRDSTGQIVHWYVLLADVDDRKRAEDAIDTARSELARVARVMTMSALTASIAHEVNQPLAGIVTNAGTCLRMLDAFPPNVEGAQETARRTIRDAQRASDVIARLRALFTKREFTLEPLDLNDATREVIALYSSDLQRNSVVLQSQLADDLPQVNGDRIQIQQVILNLLHNAADAMANVSDRQRDLVIRTEREGDRVRLAVCDAGIGIDQEHVDNLFDPFYSTKSAGMGIGLSISRSIIESHHGRIWATPNDGPGATFEFTIPV